MSELISPAAMIQSRKMFDVWEDLRYPAQAIRVGANAPAWDTTEVGWNFANAPPNNQEVQGVAQLPHRWREGSAIVAHLHWYLLVAGAANEDVKWDLLYRVASVDGVFPAGWTTLPITIDVSAYAIRQHILSSWAPIAMTAETVSCIIDLRVQRDTTDAADDHEQNVILKEVDIHYLVDSFGSVGQLTKWS